MKYFNRIFSVLLVVGAAVTVYSCRDDDDTEEDGKLKVEFKLVKNGTEIGLNEIFSNDSVPTLFFDKFKFYISHLTLEGHGELKDVEIVDFENDRISFTYSDITPNSYAGLSFDLGLDSAQNASYPPDFSTGHPLSASWAMFWTWATKYRFVILEGRGATDGAIDGVGDDVFIALHPGMDGWNYNVDLSNGVTVPSGGTATYTVLIDVDDMFNGPAGVQDLRVEHTTHTTPADVHIAAKFIENLADAFRAE